MASRALAAVAAGPDDYARGLRPHPLAGRAAGDPALARADVRPALAGYWGSPTTSTPPRRRARDHRGQRRQDRRHQGLAARPRARDRDAPRAARRRADVHRRRLQLPRADPRRRAGPQRRAARHLRRDRAGGGGGARGARRRRRATATTSSSRRPSRSRATSSRRRPTTTRPASSSWPTSTATRATSAWSAGRRARARSSHLAELFVLADRAGAAARSRAGRRAHAPRARARRGGAAVRPSRLDARAPEPQPDDRSTSCSLPGGDRGCGRAGLTVIGPWRHKVAEAGVEERRGAIRAAGLRVSSLCRGGFFPAADAADLRAADDDNRRAVDEAAALGTDVLVLVCGPPRRARRRAARGRRWSRGIARLLPYAEERGVRLAIEPLHPMIRRALGDRDARRGQRPGRALRRAPRRRGRRRLPRLVGPAAVRGDRARRPADPRLPRQRLARAHPRPARRAAA